MADESNNIDEPLMNKEPGFLFNAAEPVYSPTFRPSNSFKGTAISKVKADSEVALEDCTDFKIFVRSEIVRQMWLAGPMVIVNVLQYSLQLVSVMFVGHLGKLELASASVATSFASVTGFTLLIGMGSALETLCGQAYGAKQYQLLGVYLQRAVYVLYIASIPILLIWYNMGTILTAVGQDPEISIYAGQYARWLIPSLFAYASLQPIVKFLQTQSLVLPMVVCSAITTAVHIITCWILIIKLEMGNKGAALATSISYWLNVALLILYVKFSVNCKKTWSGFSKEAFSDLKSFFKLAIPSAVMICLEYWSFEMLVLLSGLLPDPQLEMSALSICLSITSISYMIPFGLSAAASTRVSNELGAGRPYAARMSVNVCLGIGLLEAFTVSTSLLLLKNKVGWAFSNDDGVVKYVSRMVPFLSTCILVDGIQGVLTGVARGCGWQSVGAFVNLGAYYIVGIPIAIIAAFFLHLRGEGLYFGILSGLTIQMIFLTIITFTTNWEKQAQNAADRWSKPENDPILRTQALDV
ncbi:hypothetical protein O6H91_04G075700 [Diphasiastrum complanatum]|uniref:Uncharacterized protein n=2 Tax=Diphasiastrum complanatum TaxID=34168 RepID=A0ACC2DYE8_DIPCM|nr:hypothetical protein O6H91_04G075700 [Diphasiastrum complanatum]KAJ7559242.1 hypothetical protein O6H91_04G075700 [Diphasiastrum complanatum]